MSSSGCDIIKKVLIDAAKRNIPFKHYKLFYFGSRASGRAAAQSDFDIGIEAEGKMPFSAMEKIKEELEDVPVLQKIDVVDFARVPQEFLMEAKKNMEIIYEQ